MRNMVSQQFGDVFREVVDLYSVTMGHTRILDGDSMVVILPNSKGVWQTTHIQGHYYGLDIRTLTGLDLSSVLDDASKEVNRINRKLACGNMYIDDDGELIYKSFIPVDSISAKDITKVIKINMESIDGYMPRLLGLLSQTAETHDVEEYRIIEGVNENDFVKNE